MKKLIQLLKRTVAEKGELPFSVYSSVKEQRIFNVPFIKPVMVCVLDGCKRLGAGGEFNCTAGSFIFLSNHPNVDMRNIPGEGEYFALLVEFDFEDFDCLPHHAEDTALQFKGNIEHTLENTLQQFVDWASFAPKTMWHVRKQEILQTLFHLGYSEVCSVMAPPSMSFKIRTILNQNISANLSSVQLASMLAMSESTLRRRLSDEGTSFQSIKEGARLGHGLHLIQSSNISVSQVAEQCGYSSQSRFTEKFKQLFGLTPRDLRKTKMRD